MLACTLAGFAVNRLRPAKLTVTCEGNWREHVGPSCLAREKKKGADFIGRVKKFRVEAHRSLFRHVVFGPVRDLRNV